MTYIVVVHIDKFIDGIRAYLHMRGKPTIAILLRGESLMENSIALTVILALISSGAIGGAFALVQFLLKLKFDKTVWKAEQNDKKDKRFDDLRHEFQSGLDQREKTGKERFDINSRLIEENTRAINDLTRLVQHQSEKYDKLVDSLETLNRMSEIMGEGVKSGLYDKIMMVTDKCLARCEGGAITVGEQANIEQLYGSYFGLGGNGEGKKRYELAINKMKVVTEEEAKQLDHNKFVS